MPDAGQDACSARGCPLRATIFDSANGPRQHGRCRYHDAAHAKNWPFVTEIFTAFPPDDIAPALRTIGIEFREPSAPRSYPGGYRTKSGHLVFDSESFAEWFVRFSAQPPGALDRDGREMPDRVGTFARLGAIPRTLDFEAIEERRAMQAESDPLP
jgi:hypothetical protein